MFYNVEKSWEITINLRKTLWKCWILWCNCKGVHIWLSYSPSTCNFAIKWNPLQIFSDIFACTLGRPTNTLDRKEATLGTIHVWRPHKRGWVLEICHVRSIVYFCWWYGWERRVKKLDIFLWKSLMYDPLEFNVYLLLKVYQFSFFSRWNLTFN